VQYDAGEMSTKELVLEAIQRLPAGVSLQQIRDRIEFLAALDRAEQSLDRGKGLSQEEVEARFETSVRSWATKSSGRRKHSKTSKL
jgi:hypothetical protein